MAVGCGGGGGGGGDVERVPHVTACRVAALSRVAHTRRANFLPYNGSKREGRERGGGGGVGLKNKSERVPWDGPCRVSAAPLGEWPRVGGLCCVRRADLLRGCSRPGNAFRFSERHHGVGGQNDVNVHAQRQRLP
jgi:hypothetical protein